MLIFTFSKLYGGIVPLQKDAANKIKYVVNVTENQNQDRVRIKMTLSLNIDVHGYLPSSLLSVPKNK